MNEALMITHILISWIALVAALCCGVVVIGLRNSTHQVQFVQADETEVDKELDTEHERYEEEML